MQTYGVKRASVVVAVLCSSACAIGSNDTETAPLEKERTVDQALTSAPVSPTSVLGAPGPRGL